MATAAAVKIAPEPEPHCTVSIAKAADGAAVAGAKNGNGAARAAAIVGPRHIDADAVEEQIERLSAQELRAWRGLLRVHACLAKRLDAALDSKHGLPMSSYEVLHRLEGAEQARMRMCDLAEQAQMSRSGLTRLVDRLERDGLLERCSCKHDARGAYACLTPAGRQRLRAARATHLAVIRESFLSCFSAGELSKLAELWDRVAPPCSDC